MDNFTLNDVWAALLLFLAGCAAVSVIGGAWTTIKKWRKPSIDVADALSRDKRRLDSHDRDITDLKEGMKALCEGTNALLNHAIHNGNTDEMIGAQKRLNSWLIDR